MKNLFPFWFIVIISVLFTTCQKDEEIYDNPIKTSAIIKNVSTFSGNDGSIDLTVSGGAFPYSFFWSNNFQTEDIENLTAGTYIVVITDNQYHMLTDTFEVKQPQPGTFSISFNVTYPSETGASDGSIDVTIAGGYPPYTYMWSTGSTDEDLVGITAGSYTLNVTDSEGQTQIDSVSFLDLLTDIDGNSYQTVKIGDQVWMKENLKVIHAPDGTQITSYIYNNDTSNLNIYGRLYTWDVAMNGTTIEMNQGICPSGWHIPGDEEVKTLEMELGMTREDADLDNTWRGENVGAKLKIGGSSGFDAKLSGRRASNGTFGFIDRAEYFWTSTEFDENYAWRRCLDKFETTVGRYNTFQKNYGFSVRCIKNDD